MQQRARFLWRSLTVVCLSGDSRMAEASSSQGWLEFALELQTWGRRLRGSVGGSLAWMSGVPLGPELLWRME